MTYIILSNLQLLFFFVCLIVKRFEKVFIRYLAISYIVVYYTTIILNAVNKVANYMEFQIFKGWLT